MSDGTGYVYKRLVEFSPGTENSTSRHRDRERAVHDMGLFTCSHLTVICPRKDKGNPGNLPAAGPGNTRSFHEEQEIAATSPPQHPHASKDAPLRMRSGSLSPFLRCLHRRVETGGRADAGLNPGGFPGRSRMLSVPFARMAQCVASRLWQTQYAACCAAGGGGERSVPPVSGGMVHPAGGTAREPGRGGSCGQGLWWLPLPVLEVVLLVRNYL